MKLQNYWIKNVEQHVDSLTRRLSILSFICYMDWKQPWIEDEIRENKYVYVDF